MRIMGKVLKFTFKQHVSTKSYRLTTVIIAAILIIGCIAGFKIAESVSGSKTVSDIDTVFVCDSSSLSGTDYSVLHESGDKLFENVKFVSAQTDDIEEAAKEAASCSDHSCVLELKNDEQGKFIIRVIKPEGFAAEKKSAKNLSEFVKDNLRFAIFEKSGLTDVQKNELLTHTEIKMSVAGEDGNSEDAEMLRNFIPVFIGLLLYMMLCIYGQGVARCVVAEKDSKMMETLLVMTRPYDMIFGKIFGMYFAAVLQLSVWIASLGAGMIAGIKMSDGAGEKAMEFISMLSEKGGFSPSAMVIAVISLFAGFLLYVALAAFTGTFASKTEEVNNYYGIYTMVIVVCWIFPYMNQLNGNEHMLSILRLVPFTAPFAIPADVLIGNTSIMIAVISTLLVILSTAVVVFAAAKVYKAFVLYRGEPLKIKDALRIVKRKG